MSFQLGALLLSLLGFAFLVWRLTAIQALVNDRLTAAVEEVRGLKAELGLKNVALEEADRVDATLGRIEAAATAARVHGEEVARDLLESHERADATEGPHGAAADAASQSPRDQTEGIDQ
jgi:GTP cyclohydrolase II